MAKKNKPVSAKAAQDALHDIDRVFHEKARLGIMTTIIGFPDGMNFIELKELCSLTDGNLNRHLKVLVDTGVLSVKKTGQGRNTNSLYRITTKGRRAFEQYLSALETILSAAKQSAAEPTRSGKSTGRDDGVSPAMG
ncbi:MAG: transcriptional regulator [Mariniblastus sp.]